MSIMDHVPPVIKEHPYIIGGVVVTIVLLYYFYSGSSSTGTTVATTTTTDPNAGAQATQLAIAQLNAGVASNNTAAQLGAVQTQDAAQLQAASLTQAVQLASVSAQQNVDQLNISSSAQTAQAQITGQVDIAALSLQGIEAQLGSQVTIDQQNNIAQNVNAATIAATQTHLADLQAAVTQTEINALTPKPTVATTDPITAQVLGLYSSVLDRNVGTNLAPDAGGVQYWSTYDAANGPLATEHALALSAAQMGYTGISPSVTAQYSDVSAALTAANAAGTTLTPSELSVALGHAA